MQCSAVLDSGCLPPWTAQRGGRTEAVNQALGQASSPYMYACGTLPWAGAPRAAAFSDSLCVLWHAQPHACTRPVIERCEVRAPYRPAQARQRLPHGHMPPALEGTCYHAMQPSYEESKDAGKARQLARARRQQKGKDELQVLRDAEGSSHPPRGARGMTWPAHQRVRCSTGKTAARPGQAGWATPAAPPRPPAWLQAQRHAACANKDVAGLRQQHAATVPRAGQGRHEEGSLAQRQAQLVR